MRGRGPGGRRRLERLLRRSLAVAALALAACSGWFEWRRAEPPAPPPPAPHAEPAPPEPCRRIERVEVRKSERTLVAECMGGARLAFRIGLSREAGPKRRRGDHRTPEGEYRIAAPARASRFHRFLPIDYPSLADAERALAEGRISEAERDAIARAHAEGRLPP